VLNAKPRRAARLSRAKKTSQRNRRKPRKITVAYRRPSGKMLQGHIEDALNSTHLRKLKGRVNLIFTSPPFPLVRKKSYGNKVGNDYLEWLKGLAPKLAGLLTRKGSIVIELGNAWVKGVPAMSTLPLKALLAFQEAGNLHLCQYIICHNPARLPTPAQWVNIKRVRLKDSFTHVWWLSKSEHPKASNRKVLLPYSADMQNLLRLQKYNAGKRPSGHDISPTGFLTNHGGAISPSVVSLAENARIPEALMQMPNTSWDANYREYCKRHKIKEHPARMRPELAGFFVEMLTNRRDIVLDPFAGSNTTGAVADFTGRRWIGVEQNKEFIKGSKGRFHKKEGRRNKRGASDGK
jgi:DNA modification methylase